MILLLVCLIRRACSAICQEFFTKNRMEGRRSLISKNYAQSSSTVSMFEKCLLDKNSSMPSTASISHRSFLIIIILSSAIFIRLYSFHYYYSDCPIRKKHKSPSPPSGTHTGRHNLWDQKQSNVRRWQQLEIES